MKAPRARLLGLGSKLFPNNKQHMRNKNLAVFLKYAFKHMVIYLPIPILRFLSFKILVDLLMCRFSFCSIEMKHNLIL